MLRTRSQTQYEYDIEMSTEKLILLVQKYEMLYNMKHKDHKDAEMRTRIWGAIGKELNLSGK